MGASPRVLVGSDFNVGARAYNTIPYEFCKVVLESEDAELLAPPSAQVSALRRAVGKVSLRVRERLGVDRAAMMQPTEVTGTHDLFFYVIPFPHSLVELSRMGGWRARSGKAVAFLVESWSRSLHQHASSLRLLDQFDHVFVFNKASVPNVQKYTRTPCSFLATGADTLLLPPALDPASRVIDVYSMGRRSPLLHEQLVEMARRREIFYQYDSLSGTDSRVFSWDEHRLLTMSLISRSRYFIAFDHNDVGGHKAVDAGGEKALTARVFEGAAAGSVMIGSPPDCPEFAEFFPWPDAVIDIRGELGDARGLLQRLDAREVELAALRRRNIAESLRRHDWCYRWREVLDAVGLEHGPKLRERIGRLNAMADEIERPDRDMRIQPAAAD